MDQTNCSFGYATDRSFIRNEFNTCDTSLIAYWFCIALICIFKLLACLLKCQGHRARNKTLASRRKHDNNSPLGEGGNENNEKLSFYQKYKTVISITTTSVHVVLYSLVGILLGLDVANVYNGISFSLYSLAYLPFIIDFNIMLFKIVRMGKGAFVLPKTEELGETKYLTKFSRLGMFLTLFQTLAAFTACIVLIILSPIFPEDDGLLGVIGFASKGIFQISCSLGISHQFERCVRLLKSFKKRVPITSETEEFRKKLDAAIRTLRKRQLFVLAFGGLVGVFYIVLASNSALWTWALVIIVTSGPEAIGHFVVEYFFNSKRRKLATASHTKSKSFNVKSEPGSKVEFSTKASNLKSTNKNKFWKPRNMNWKMQLSKVSEEEYISSYQHKD